jgi:hypothetical protein
MDYEQLVSVADAIVRDAATGDTIMLGTANISSAFNLTMANTDVRGGIGNKLLYSYYHTRELTVDIEQATFGEQFISLNVGSTVSTGAVRVVQTDCLTTSASSAAQITLTPIGNVSVVLADGVTVQTVTPSTKDIQLSGCPNQRVTAIYETSKTADQITVGATTPPSIVDLTLLADIYDQSHTSVLKKLQINIPSFQIAGNYTLNLTANGVSTEKITGKALAVTATDCTSGDYYAKVTYIPVSTTAAYTNIAAIPSTITWPKLTAESTQISVLGIKGGVYANTNITTDCTFARSGSSGSNITVGASTGVVSTSASSLIAAQAITIAVTYPSGSLVDYVTINVTG